MPSPKPSVAVLLTCFNRRETTLAALRAMGAAVGDSCTYEIVLVDDGSGDGTAEAVISAFPQAHVIRGPGNLFWNRGMRLAWQSALPLAPDFFLWLNDDTVLRKGAIADLITAHQSAPSPKTIIVGCLADPKTGAITYGGYRLAEGSLSRLRIRHFEGEAECDTMNGNCVLFPASAARDIGINSERYSHAFGDVDYGFRAVRAGYKIIQFPVPVALQERNEQYADSVSRLTLKNWRFIFTHPKGIPIREWYGFCREFGGPFWPINFVFRYLKIMRI